jgi:hypothetical protein
MTKKKKEKRNLSAIIASDSMNLTFDAQLAAVMNRLATSFPYLALTLSWI